MLRYFLLAIMMICLTSAIADEVSHRAAAKTLLEVTEISAMVDEMHIQIEKMFKQMAVNILKDYKGEDKQAMQTYMNEYMNKLAVLLREEFSLENMEGDLIDLYIQVFSEQEILELIDFYQSELGQKILAKMPALMQASMEINQRHLKTFLPKVEALVQEMQTNIKNKP